MVRKSVVETRFQAFRGYQFWKMIDGHGCFQGAFHGQCEVGYDD